MKLAFASFTCFLSEHPQRFAVRIMFLLLISITTILCLFISTESPRVALGQTSREAVSSLKIVVRDSMTGYTVPSEIVSPFKNGLFTLATGDAGHGIYQLSSGRNDLDIHAAGHQSLQTHFEPGTQSVMSVTVWVDPLESPLELRPEVIGSKIRAGYALLHGHVFDCETGLPLAGAHLRLERAGVESQTDSRGYFLFYAPVPAINPTVELPASDNLIADLEGYKVYRRDSVTLTEGATHFIIDMNRGKGVTENDDTHKLMLSPEQLKNNQTEIPEIDDKKLSSDSLDARGGVVQPLALTVPSSIRVGSNCPSKTSCTTFNVYSLDTYVKNGLDDEWFSSWNANSLKAGAIAYRSYGVYYVYHPISTNYDICNTTSCQVNDPTDSATSTNSATDNTTGMIVVDSTGSKPFFAEYAAENNDSSCADGFTGSPSANWSCMSDSVDAGQPFNGHGRGMCQWGTQRWAINQGKDYVWIVNHYYNDNGNPSGARSGVLQTPTPQKSVQFAQAGFSVSEGGGAATITVTRAGDLSASASVDYSTPLDSTYVVCSTISGQASLRCDYTTTGGTLSFAPGEASKSFTVPIIDDAFVEGNETILLSLSNPAGATLSTPNTATLTIIDNDAAQPSSNPIDDAQVFVRQHYLDFLSREPDAGGLDYWSSQITQCGADPTCINSKRIGVSAAFFIELEFQETGNFVYRVYKASYGVRPTFAQFVADRAKVVAGSDIAASKDAFVRAWVQRAEFQQAYQPTLAADQFVNKLYDTAGLTPYEAERAAQIAAMNSGKTRAQVLRDLIEIQAFKDREYNPAFVLMQYFGYLRRDPDEGGYQFWLDVLNNKVPNNYRGMVCAFITSAEYQARFSSIATRNDSLCSTTP